jgi:hypothetical protein
VLGALAAVAALAVGGAVLWGRQTQSLKLGAADDLAALRCAPEVGFSAAYRLQANTHMRFNASSLIGNGNGPDQMVDSSALLNARLRVVALKEHKEGVLLAFAIDKLSADGKTSQTPPELQKQLTEPFYAVLDDTCRLRSFAFAKTVPPEAVNRLQSMIQALSFALRSSLNQKTWVTQEWDGTGQYTAQYERTQPARSFFKKRRNYVQAHAASAGINEAIGVRVVESGTRVQLDDRGAWLSGANGKEHVQLTRANGTLLADLETEITLERSEDQAEAMELANTLEGASWRVDSAPPLASDVRDPEPPDSMKTLALNAALDQFAAMYRAGAGIRSIDFLKLYLRARPEMAQEIMRMIEGRLFAAELEPALFHALELANTPQARDALITGLTDVHTTDNRARAAAAITDIRKPTPAVLKGLSEMAERGKGSDERETVLVRNSAVFALGRLEGKLRERDPALAAQTAKEMSATLGRAKDATERTAALDAIGNSGNPKFLTEVKPLLETEDKLVRAHAIQAMEHMPPESNKDMFKGLMASEKDAQVRGTIALTYTDQARRANQLPPKQVLDGAIQQLPLEPDARVRALLIDLIGPAAELYPVAMGALVAQFPRESEPTLLKLIGKYVSADKLGV